MKRIRYACLIYSPMREGYARAKGCLARVFDGAATYTADEIREWPMPKEVYECILAADKQHGWSSIRMRVKDTDLGICFEIDCWVDSEHTYQEAIKAARRIIDV